MSAEMPPSEQVLEEAARWRERHEAGLSREEQADFDRWLGGAGGQAQAWLEISRTEVALAHLRAEAGGEFAGQRPARRPWARPALLAAAGAAAMVALAFVLTRTGPEPSPPTAPTALLVPADVQVLPDDSRVELDQAAGISLDFGPALRRVQLRQGTAYFRVTKDPARPFVVAANRVQVRAVGTEFAVEEHADRIVVLVTEGKVAVLGGDAAGRADAVFVAAGQELNVPIAPAASPLEPRTVDAAEMARRLAWRGPRLRLAATPLSEAVAAINRVGPERLIVADGRIEGLRLTGIFPARDAGGFARLLHSAYGLRLEKRPDGSIALWGR